MMELQKEQQKPEFVLDSVTTPQQMTQFASLLNRAFPVPQGSNFLHDFPIWDKHAENSADPLVRIGVYRGTELAGCAGVRLGDLQNPRGGTTRIALVGAVATDERYRSKGLASEMVKYACNWAASREAAFVMLWGAEHDLYRRIGFELSGAQIRVPLEALELPAPTVALGRGWQPAIFPLIQARATGLVLRAPDIEWYGAHKNVEWFTVGAPGKPTAYAAVGRGIDVQNLVHEFGGDKADLAKLLAKLAVERPGLSILASPAILGRVGIAIRKSHATPPEEFLCMLRALNPSVRLPDPFWLWGLDAV